MSGFAHMNGYPDGPPTFPSTTLADGVASVWGVVGVLAALVGKLRGNSSGVEVADVALFEGLFRIIPTQIPTYQQLGKVQSRPGNYLGDHGVLRNVYGSRDGRYLAISSVGPQAIRRILVGAKADALIAIIDQGVMNSPDVHTVETFLGQCNEHLLAWAAARDYAELTADLSAAGAVFSPVYSAADIVKDEHYQARGDLPLVPDKDLGPIMMQGVVPKFHGRRQDIAHAGQAAGTNNEEVFGALGLSAEELAELKAQRVI
jgi:formyl-CoA transferase